MKVINHLENYKTLNSVQSKYFYGVTSGDSPREIATAKQLWKLQDLSNKLYHYYYAIESALDADESNAIMNHLDETKQAIDVFEKLNEK